jgi:hypothetical protein
MNYPTASSGVASQDIFHIISPQAAGNTTPKQSNKNNIIKSQGQI